MSDVAMHSRRRFLQQAGSWIALGAAAPGVAWLAGCARPDTLVGSRLRALGTEVTLLVRSPDTRRAERAVRRALRQVATIHQEFTLFEPSPLRQLNVEAHRRRVPIQPWLREILEQALAIQRQSQGHFDPALGGPRKARWSTLDVDETSASTGVEIDDDGAWLRLHGPGTALDLNGICKGAAVDRAAAVLRARGLHDFVVNAGGDLLASGDADDGEPGWSVRLQRGRGLPALSLRLRDQAAATSGNVDRGRAGNAHHLVAPGLGQLTDPLRTATAICQTAARADAWATALFVAGPAQALALCARTDDLAAILVHHDGHAVHTGTT